MYYLCMMLLPGLCFEGSYADYKITEEMTPVHGEYKLSSITDMCGSENASTASYIAMHLFVHMLLSRLLHYTVTILTVSYVLPYY